MGPTRRTPALAGPWPSLSAMAAQSATVFSMVARADAGYLIRLGDRLPRRPRSSNAAADRLGLGANKVE